MYSNAVRPVICEGWHITNNMWIGVWCMVLSTNFNSISVISRRSVLLVDETGVPGENHRPVANKGNNKITEHRAIF